MVARDDVDFELREIDEDILDILEDGRCTRKHLSTLLGVSSDYIYQRIDLMDKLGLINIIHDGFYELADDADVDEDHAHAKSAVDEDNLPDRAEPAVEESDPATDQLQSDQLVDDAVGMVSTGWDDTEMRMEARRAAARAVLQHAVDTGDAVGKADAIDQFLPEHAVDGQGDETWWRKNIRPVLKAVGEYSNGSHGYVVWEGDVDEFVDEEEK